MVCFLPSIELYGKELRRRLFRRIHRFYGLHLPTIESDTNCCKKFGYISDKLVFLCCNTMKNLIIFLES